MKKKKQIILFSVVFAMVILMIISFVLITMNVKSSKSTDLLFEAIENNDVQTAKEAIENGADLNKSQKVFSLVSFLGESHNPTPLWEACHKCDLEMVKLLVSSGADINALEPISKTSPLRATFITVGKDERFSIAKYLIENGADINLGNQTDVVLEKVLIGTGDNNEQIRNEAQELLLILIDKGFNLNSVREKSALTYLARYKNNATIAFLVKNKYCDINSLNYENQTALIVAAQLNDDQMVELLLSLGIDKGIKDTYGKTAYDYAKELGYTKISDMLK